MRYFSYFIGFNRHSAPSGFGRWFRILADRDWTIQKVHTRFFDTYHIYPCRSGPTDRCIRNRRVCEWPRNPNSLWTHRDYSPATDQQENERTRGTHKSFEKQIVKSPRVHNATAMTYLSESGQVVNHRFSCAYRVVGTPRVRWKRENNKCDVLSYD